MQYPDQALVNFRWPHSCSHSTWEWEHHSMNSEKGVRLTGARTVFWLVQIRFFICIPYFLCSWLNQQQAGHLLFKSAGRLLPVLALVIFFFFNILAQLKAFPKWTSLAYLWFLSCVEWTELVTPGRGVTNCERVGWRVTGSGAESKSRVTVEEAKTSEGSGQETRGLDLRKSSW